MKDKLMELQQETSPFKIYIQKEIPMLENLLKFYRKSDGATKKKILNTIFTEKLIVINGKVTAPTFTEPIKLMLKISKSMVNSKEKNEVIRDLKLF
jgi:site-specific DNA recombinase